MYFYGAILAVFHRGPKTDIQHPSPNVFLSSCSSFDPNSIYAVFRNQFLCILNLYIRKPRPMGAVSGLFLIGYGAFRIIVEFFRQPDARFTGAWVQYISMGQILSIPMIVAGVIMMVWAYRRSPQQHVS